jgi:RHS repeat-associated protein
MEYLPGMGYYAAATFPEKPAPLPKNRVGVFSASARFRAGRSASQVIEHQHGKPPTLTDTASGVRYYGYRFLSPELGWISRDPIEEDGGLNVYGFARNIPISHVDYLGQYDPDDPATGTTFPSQPGPDGTIHYTTPPWFEYPSDEGKPCCCSPAATLVKFDRSDAGSGMRSIAMQVDIELTGCYKDIKWLWWTCRRPDDSFGIFPECGINSSACSFGEIPPYFASYITRVHLRYLSCENNVWVKKTHVRGVGYVWHWTPSPPHYGPQ